MGNCINHGYCKFKDDYNKNCTVKDESCKYYVELKNEIYKAELMIYNNILEIKELILKFFKNIFKKVRNKKWQTQ